MSFEEKARRALLKNLPTYVGVAMKSLRLSVEDMARLTDLSPQSVAALEQGDDCELPMDFVAEFASFLGLTPEGRSRAQHPGRAWT